MVLVKEVGVIAHAFNWKEIFLGSFEMYQLTFRYPIGSFTQVLQVCYSGAKLPAYRSSPRNILLVKHDRSYMPPEVYGLPSYDYWIAGKTGRGTHWSSSNR